MAHATDSTVLRRPGPATGSYSVFWSHMLKPKNLITTLGPITALPYPRLLGVFAFILFGPTFPTHDGSAAVP